MMQETEESQTGLIEIPSHHAGTSFLDHLAQAVRIMILDIIKIVWAFVLIKTAEEKTFLAKYNWICVFVKQMPNTYTLLTVFTLLILFKLLYTA